jgi:hypothetical protein
MSNGLVVTLTNRSDLTCAAVSPGIQFANLVGLGITVWAENGLLAPGTYDIAGQGTSYAEAVFGTTNATCNPGEQGADSGSITLSEVSSLHVTGTFDLMFGKDSVSGTFDSDICTFPVVEQDAGTICKP